MISQITTLAELQQVMVERGLRGVQLSFGPSASPIRHGQWFAIATKGGNGVLEQVRASDLTQTLNGLFGLCDVEDVITEAPKVVLPPSAPPVQKVIAAPPASNLTDLLL